MSRYKKTVLDRLAELERMVDQVTRSIEKIEVATIVREPRSQVAVDAYDGLRRQIIAAAGERMAHLHQLVLFAEAVTVPGAPSNLAGVVMEWMQQAGVERVEELRDPNYYEVLTGTGSELRVLRPAYRDRVTGRPIRMGQTERFTAVPPGHPYDGEPTQDGHREAAR
jgi:hypothetical protein